MVGISDFSNVAEQVLLRRQQGLGALFAGICLVPLWQAYKHLGGPAIVIETWRKTRFLLEPKSITSSRFVYEGRPDQRLVETLAAFGGPDVAFADVGANVGLYTILLCKDFAEGWMFDPNPVAVAAIRANLGLNAASERFHIVQKAVGAAPGTVYFPEIASADPAARVSEGPHAGSFAVPMTTLDETLPPDRDYVVKIDAEGFDAQVVAGMSGLMQAERIRICLFECHTIETLAEVMAAASPHGYAVMDGERELVQPTQDRRRDLMLVPRRLRDHYAAVARRLEPPSP